MAEPTWHDHLATLLTDVEQLWEQEREQLKDKVTVKKLTAKLWLRNSMALVIVTLVIIFLGLLTWFGVMIAGGFALYEVGLPASLSVLAMTAINFIPLLLAVKFGRLRKRELKEHSWR